MMSMYEIGKTAVLRWLPDALLKRLKRRHYLRKVDNVRISDEPDLAIVGHLVSPGDCVVDIGANIGIYTVYLSRAVTTSGRVFSFEPVPTTFDFLVNNIRGLGLENVVARQVAITDQRCMIQMVIPRDDQGLQNFYQAAVISERAEKNGSAVVDVDGLPLDLALPGSDIGNVKFIKCDIEGHELRCLEGAINVVARSRPAWLMEVSEDPGKSGSNAGKVFALMRENGYEVWVYREEKLVPWNSDLRSVNYWFLTGDHVRQLVRRMAAANQ